jgi:hypothetical protein
MTKREFLSGIVARARREGKGIWDLVQQVNDRASMVALEEACWQLGAAVGGKALAQALEWIEEHREGERCARCARAMQRQRLRRSYQTLVGTVCVERWYYYCRGCGSSRAPLDEWLEGDGQMSLGVQARLCEAGAEWGFDRASKKLWRLARVRVSATALCTYTRWWAAKGMRRRLRGSWRLGPNEPVNLAIDAGKVHTKERGWRDMKIAYFYDDEQRRRHYVVGIEGVEEFGPRVRRAASGKGVSNTEQLFVRGDGADWVWTLCERQLPGSRQLVDFYHVAQQVATFGKVVFGEDSAEGRSWLDEQLHRLKHEGARAVLEEVRSMKLTRKAGRQARRGLLNYVLKRIERMDYPGYLGQGWDIGSGPVESACKELIGARLKRGRRWLTHNAVNVANLRALFLSDQWDQFWKEALAA